MKKLARVVVKPRDRRALELGRVDASTFIKRGFGVLALEVDALSVEDEGWRANVTLDVGDATLVQNAADERLWRAFVEASFTAGSCTVVEIAPADR